MGPMTGRAAGYCTGNQVPGFMNPGPGRGWFGRGGFGGGGRGWRHSYYATGMPGWMGGGFPGGYQEPSMPYEMTAKQEISALREQANYLGGCLKDIEARIKEIDSEVSREGKNSE